MGADAEAPAYDVVVIGAGLSGINAAYRLQTTMPDCSFTILEARHCLGGTWSFWQYPGVRSDSNMGLFSFPWHPWPHDVSLAPAPLINAYLEDAARTHGIRDKVRFGHRATAASWDSAAQQWTLDVAVTPAEATAGDAAPAPAPTRTRVRAWFVLNCGGYYAYDRALETTIPGLDTFRGAVLHPQFWPSSSSTSDLLSRKRVVLVGSGATAVTLLPALLLDAHPPPARVTMLQRSPSYVFALQAAVDPLTRLLRRALPARWAAWLIWWRHMLQETLEIGALLAFPRLGRRLLTAAARKRLPPGFDVDRHFGPAYDPFEQRVCATPGGDFFDALWREDCEVVTDGIAAVTEHAVRTASGRVIPADVIITATGLFMRVFGAFAVAVDGVPFRQEQVSDRYVWNGVMIEGLPNLGSVMGYITGSWTPGADVRTRLLLAVMGRMRSEGVGVATPTIAPGLRAALPRKPVLPNSSTYIVDARRRMPLVADVGPWRNRGRWIWDWLFLWFGDKKEGLAFTPRKGGDGRQNGKVKTH